MQNSCDYEFRLSFDGPLKLRAPECKPGKYRAQADLADAKEKVSQLEASIASQDKRLHIAVAAAEATREELRAAKDALAASRSETTGLTAQTQV